MRVWITKSWDIGLWKWFSPPTPAWHINGQIRIFLSCASHLYIIFGISMNFKYFILHLNMLTDEQKCAQNRKNNKNQQTNIEICAQISTLICCCLLFFPFRVDFCSWVSFGVSKKGNFQKGTTRCGMFRGVQIWYNYLNQCPNHWEKHKILENSRFFHVTIGVTNRDFCVTIYQSMRNFISSPTLVISFELELPVMRKMRNTLDNPQSSSTTKSME
jgi:hypothetical protein